VDGAFIIPPPLVVFGYLLNIHKAYE